MKKLLLASLAVASVAGCRIKGDPTFDPPPSTCHTVGLACSENAGCCSYACFGGLCVANTVAGGLCRTSDDCTFTMSCVSEHCQPGATCSNNGVGCTSNNACCSGNCVGFDNFVSPPVPGTCTANTAPAVEAGGPYTVPYYATTTLHATVTDPNPADVMYYRWDVVSAPSTAGLAGWTSSLAAPSVFLRAKGTYQLRVTVVDGPSSQAGRLTGQDTVTITAVNLAPVVAADPTHLATTVLRNTSFQLVGSVVDPNGDPAVTIACEWYATPPGQAEISTPIWSSASCPASPATTYRTPIDSAEGPWRFRLHASDGELDASDVRTVTVVNAAPVALACAYECQTPPGNGVPFVRAGNLGPPGGTTPSIPLQGSATDDNGDVATAGFAWEWRLDQRPAGSTVPLGSLLGSGTGAAPPPFAGSLDPDVAGTYLVRLHVDDGRGATADATVPVVVEPWLRPLHAVDGVTLLPLGGVADASFIHAATVANDRLVYVGADGTSGTSRLWVLDPEAAASAAVPYVVLGETPRCLGVAPAGDQALVAGDASGSPRWQRISLTGSPTASAANTFGLGWSGTPSDVLSSGAREFAVSTTGAVHQLGTSAGSSSAPATCDASCSTASIAGTQGTATTDTLFLLAGATLRRYTVKPNGDLQNPATATVGTSSDVWVSALHGTSRELAVSAGDVVSALTPTLSPAATLPFAARHLDTATVSTVLQGIAVSAAGTRVERLDASYGAVGTLPIPRVGWLGTGYPGEAVFAFVRSDGSARYVVLRATVAGAVRWYLARY